MDKGNHIGNLCANVIYTDCPRAENRYLLRY